MKITFEGTVEEAFGEMVLFLSTMRGEGYLEASPPPAREQWLPAESKVAKVLGPQDDEREVRKLKPPKRS